MRLTFEVNGVPRELDVEPDTRLIVVLRLHLGLTGTKEACGEGECGGTIEAEAALGRVALAHQIGTDLSHIVPGISARCGVRCS